MPDSSESTQNINSPAAPVIYLLDELATVVSDITDDQYTQCPVGVMPGTIGGHVRHCLDHIESLLNSLGTGFLDYDDRQRGTDVETKRISALDLMQDQINRLQSLPTDFIQAPINLRVMMVAGADSIEVESSVGRELAFVLSHTVHHNAIVGAMAKTLSVQVPDRFGYAPATVVFLDKH